MHQENLLKISNYFLEIYFDSIVNKIAKDKEYLVLKSENRIKDWGKYFDKAPNLKDKLEANEKKKTEQDAINTCRGNAFRNINNYLRGKPIYSKTLKLTKNRIDKIVGTINTFQVKDNILVIRRMKNKYLTKDYKKNGEFIEKGFLSTSLNINYRSNSQGGLELLNNESLLLIKVPKKLNALYIENIVPKEIDKSKFELILQRDYLMKVEYKRRIFNNNIIVLKVITKNVG